MATVEIAKRCLDEDLSDLPEETQDGILKKIAILATDPEYGKPLVRELKGYRRLTYGRYRIVYRYHPRSDSCFVVLVGVRKGAETEDVYAQLRQRLAEQPQPATNEFGRLLEEVIKRNKAHHETKRGKE